MRLRDNAAVKGLAKAAPFLLGGLFLLLPLCKIAAYGLNYTFRLNHPTAYGAGIAAAALLLAGALFLPGVSVGKPGRAAASFLPFLALLHGGALFSGAGTAGAAIAAVLTAFAAAAVFLRWKARAVLMAVMGCLAVLLFVLLALLIGLRGAFSGFSQDTVIRTLLSPDGLHTAEVIDRDQGALGGNTVVAVREARPLSIGIGQFEKKPVVLYRGEWKDSETIDIAWQDNNTLQIDSEPYDLREFQ